MTEETAERRSWLEPGWAGPAITALAGGAYLLGYLETAFFASALGVTAKDLGLDIKDYAVLALLNVAVFGLACGGLWIMDKCNVLSNAEVKAWINASKEARRGRRLVLAIFGGWTGSAVLSAAGVLGLGLTMRQALVVILGLCLIWVVGLPLILDTRRRGAIATGVVVFVLAAMGAACYSSHVYASQLWADVAAGRDPRLPPPPLRPILQPERGVATHGTNTTCAVRVAPRVLLGRGAVTVGDTDRFTVRRCDVADVPFG